MFWITKCYIKLNSKILSCFLVLFSLRRWSSSKNPKLFMRLLLHQSNLITACRSNIRTTCIRLLSFGSLAIMAKIFNGNGWPKHISCTDLPGSPTEINRTYFWIDTHKIAFWMWQWVWHSGLALEAVGPNWNHFCRTSDSQPRSLERVIHKIYYRLYGKMKSNQMYVLVNGPNGLKPILR